MARLRSLLFALFVVGLLTVPGATLLITSSSSDEAPDTSNRPLFLGRVIDTKGHPIEGARVTVGAAEDASDPNGRFAIPSPVGHRAALIEAEEGGHVTRIRAAVPDVPTILRMTPRLPGTVSLRFTGDVMFGRRFYDPNEDGIPNDGALTPGSTIAQHEGLLEEVQPLLEGADLSVVNLETPLVPDARVVELKGRGGFHPTKEFVLASAPASAAALERVGVDVVNVANNHLYDALDRGVRSSLSALERAGFERGHTLFGGGVSPVEALAPAIVRVRGDSFAFIGCTSITEPIEDGVVLGDQVSYVAEEGKAGAAACDPKVIAARVSRLSKKHSVIVQVHGGYEYERRPSPSVREVTRTARRAGATLVVNHHPHVVGGLIGGSDGLVAWTLGNFVFDQTVWPTFESYVLTVDLHDGKVVRAYIDPLMIEDYTPRPVAGGLAAHVTRTAAGLSPEGFVMEAGTLELDVTAAAQHVERDVVLDGPAEGNDIWKLPQDVSVKDPGDLELGRDLLWVGSFEDEDTDAARLEGALWSLRSEDVSITGAAARAGRSGARLERTSSNCSDVFLYPIHRILVDGGADLTMAGWIRRSATARAPRLQLSWYPDTKGPSRTWTLVDLPDAEPGTWTPFRVDVRAPRWAVAVGPYLRFPPPTTEGEAHLDVDDLALISWGQDADEDGFDHVRGEAGRAVTLAKDAMPGVQAGTPAPPDPLGAAELRARTNQEPQETGC